MYGSKCTPPFDLFHSMQNSFNLSILVNPTLVNVLRILYNRSPPMRFKAMPETRKRTTVVTVGQISIRQRSITLFTTDKGNSRRLSCHLITFVKSWQHILQLYLAKLRSPSLYLSVFASSFFYVMRLCIATEYLLVDHFHFQSRKMYVRKITNRYYDGQSIHVQIFQHYL